MSFWSFVLSQFVWIPWVRKPFETPVENPFDHGMNNTDNVRIQIPESEDTIGAWSAFLIHFGFIKFGNFCSFWWQAIVEAVQLNPKNSTCNTHSKTSKNIATILLVYA